jgi:hypothetical protein
VALDLGPAAGVAAVETCIGKCWTVIPVKSGVQGAAIAAAPWTPAFAGVTNRLAG